MIWLMILILLGAAILLTLAGLMLAFGLRFLHEFTRPGVTVEQGSALWGGWTFPDAVHEPPDDAQRAVMFHTADGACLRGAFWAQAHKAPTIIISHGFHLPSVYFRSVAALEYSHGANVLLFDYRGHGNSELLPTSCGTAEVNDLAAAVEVAISQAETASGQVYIHGFSMGAAVALLLPPHAAIAGIIADSPYARLDDMLHLLTAQIFDQQTAAWPELVRVVRFLFPSLARLTVLGGKLLFHARYRHSLAARPDQAISAHTSRHGSGTSGSVAPPILLIHATDDPLIALHHAHRLVEAARAAGRSIQAYFTPCAIHCGSYGHDPQRYISLLQAFIKAQVGMDAKEDRLEAQGG